MLAVCGLVTRHCWDTARFGMMGVHFLSHDVIFLFPHSSPGSLLSINIKTKNVKKVASSFSADESEYSPITCVAMHAHKASSSLPSSKVGHARVRMLMFSMSLFLQKTSSMTSCVRRRRQQHVIIPLHPRLQTATSPRRHPMPRPQTSQRRHRHVSNLL